MSSREWRVIKLSRACTKIGSGITPRGGNKVYQVQGVSLIRSQNVYDFTFDYGGLAYINKEQAAKMKNVEVVPEDLLLNITGDSVARCCMVPEQVLPARVNQHVSIIRTRKDILNPKYMLYWINSYSTKEFLLSLASAGGTRKALTKSMIENLKVNIPSIEEQIAISDTLSCLDDMIELNNRTNQVLEEMAQAIFKHWFVDFEFPNEEGERYKSSGGAMVDSELGEIPKGWRVEKLGEIVSVTSGKRPNTKTDSKTNEFWVPLAGASSIMGYVNEYLYDEPILVIGRVGTHGIIQRFSGPSWPSDNTLIFKSKYYEFTYQILKNIDYKVFNRGSTQPLITQTDMKNFGIILPPNDVIVVFENIIGSLFVLLQNNKIENGKLGYLRDTLLPKLMSGEIRVPLEEEVG